MMKLTGCLKDYIWGGEKLKKLYGKGAGVDGRVAESWEVSVHADGESRTESGETLGEYLRRKPRAVDDMCSPMPVLIKYIDAAKNLSVQVHPNDEYARIHEHDNGKTELWYIIEAEKGAGIYCGFKRDTSKEEFLQKLAGGSVEELLNFIPVKSGDSYLIEAGTVHAICAGCLVCEIQQSSNVTYRVYDYNRKGADGKPRELHIQKATDIINFHAYHDNTGTRVVEDGANRVRLLTECKYFRCRELTLNGGYRERNEESFTTVNVISGNGMINGHEYKGGDSFFTDCGEGLEFVGGGTILLTTE